VGVAHGVFDVGVAEYLFLHFSEKTDIAAVHHKVSGDVCRHYLPST